MDGGLDNDIQKVVEGFPVRLIIDKWVMLKSSFARSLQKFLYCFTKIFD